MAIADFRCVMRFRVPFCDVDMMQHVNNAAYVVWAETIRASTSATYWRIDHRREGHYHGAAGVDYEQPLDYREEVAVGCRVVRMGRKSFDLVYEIWSETRKERAARGLSTIVAYNYEAKTSIVIPERWREVIAAYEVVAPAGG
jgi:acyl-CoA thioester hydrolase